MLIANRTQSRRGSILPLLAVSVFSLFAFIALAVDIGMMAVARTECQDAADTAALTGARTLDNNVPTGTSASSYNNNRPAAITAATGGPNIGGVKDNYLMATTFPFNTPSIDNVSIGIYDYNSTTQIFQATFPATGADPTQKLVGSDGSVRPWTACQVTVNGAQPTYFARIFGITSMPMSATAIAVHRPRDIAMILDYSASMAFASAGQYPSGDGSSTGPIIGLMNPDPGYPQFGHYQRYAGLQTTNPNGSNPNPLQTTSYYTMASGEILSPNNHTYDATGATPPITMVNDFYTSPNTPSTAAVTPSNLQPAFTSPNCVTPMDSTTFTTQAIPFSSTTTGTMGDRWPRKAGYRTASAVSWDPTTITGAAYNVANLLFANGYNPNTPSARTIPAARPAIASSGNRTEGGTSWNNFYDDGWERNGYDLDIPTYISSNYATAQKRTTELFQGYTLGPSYWGKTFFIWPPDPRFSTSANLTSPSTTQLSFDSSGNAMCDWRRRFFLNGSGAAFNPQGDNSSGTSGTQNINQVLFNTSLNTSTSGGTLSTTSSNFQVNYPAVLAWLKSGPQTMPPNLRAGRILYYTSIPTDCTNPTTLDQTFWREYIDFVLGVTRNRTWYNPLYCLAGVDTTGWQGYCQIGATSAYKPNGATNSNPLPYMDYTDLPNMPRAHFWFGAASFMMFINPRGSFSGSHDFNYNAGTLHEAQDWQLKAAMQSCIADIQINHPNDQAGLCFFAWTSYTTPRANMGQDWATLTAALFFPNSMLADVVAGNVNEKRPYDSNFNATLVGDLPNALGGTDPNNGLAIAYNMLGNSSNAISKGTGGGGRTGATKIVIFETDGVPNSYQDWSFVSSGTNSYYNWIDAGNDNGNGDSTSINDAYNIAKQIAASTTSSSPGYSLPNSPVRIYPFAFGDMFTSTCTSSFKPTALTFLQTLAFDGNTGASTTTALPTSQVITGSYQTRIANLQTGLQAVLQSGVQVTLIQ